MSRSLVCLVLSAALIGVTLATLPASAAAPATCPTPKSHTFPTTGAATAITFGVTGGSLRTWKVALNLNGSLTATGLTTARQQLSDGPHALSGLLALADDSRYFSMKKSIGCLGSGGNPDVSGRFIKIHTSTGTKRVTSFGSCSATRSFDDLFALLQNIAGVS